MYCENRVSVMVFSGDKADLLEKKYMKQCRQIMEFDEFIYRGLNTRLDFNIIFSILICTQGCLEMIYHRYNIRRWKLQNKMINQSM